MRDKDREMRPYHIVGADDGRVVFAVDADVTADALLEAAGVSKTQRKVIFEEKRLARDGAPLAAADGLDTGDAA